MATSKVSELTELTSADSNDLFLVADVSAGQSKKITKANLGLSDENFTTTLKNKLDGIETSADVTDTANVVASLTAGTNITIAGDGTISATDTDTGILNVVEDTTPQLGGNLDLNSSNITGTGNIDTTGTLSLTNTSTGDSLTITTTEDTSTAAPVICLKRNSSTPADGDYLGQLKFQGENDADQQVVYAKITAKTSDVTDTTEDGLIEFAIRKNGSNSINARLTHDALKLINGTGLEVAGNITVTGTVDGRDVATDGTKLDGIASGATANTGTVTSVATSGGLTGGTITSTGTISIADNGVTAAKLNVTGNGTTSQFLRSDGDGSFTWATPTDTDTTYSAGTGLDLSGTTFSIEADLRDGITAVGRDTADYIGINASNIGFVVDSGERVRIENDGDLHADGDVIAYSTTISDERLKENIQPIDDALEKVKQLKGCTFTYTADGKDSAGLIAQDVEKVLPSAVSEKELPLKTDDGQTYKVLQYDQTIGLLVEAVKELTARVEELENK